MAALTDGVKGLVIIPAYNEERSILQTLDEVREAAPSFDAIVVNDGSVDRTLALCRKRGACVLDLTVNLGIGGAMQAGYLYACENGYDCAVQIDGDGQHDGAFINGMLDMLLSQEADMVIGSRFIEKKGYQTSLLRRWGIRYFSWLIRLLTGKTVTDPTSGMRMVNRGLINAFARDYPADYPEPESLVRALRQGKKVMEVPVVMRERRGGNSSIRFKASVWYMIKVTLAIILERMK